MISSRADYPFGGRVSVVEAPAFTCMVSTAKDGIFRRQSTRFLLVDETLGRLLLGVMKYHSIYSKAERLVLHDMMTGCVNELGDTGADLPMTLVKLFEVCGEKGVGIGSMIPLRF